MRSAARDGIRLVAAQAHKAIRAPLPLRVEVRAMGIHLPSGARMALHAVHLCVTGGATLQTLARRASMLQEPEGLRGVVRHIQAAT
jgi:hypothetical protein